MRKQRSAAGARGRENSGRRQGRGGTKAAVGNLIEKQLPVPSHAFRRLQQMMHSCAVDEEHAFC